MTDIREEVYDDFKIVYPKGSGALASLVCDTCTDAFGAATILADIGPRTSLTELLAIADAHMEEITL